MATVKVERDDSAQPPPVKSVTLVLTEAEAVAVACGAGEALCGGPAHTTYEAMSEAGFGYKHPLYSETKRKMFGNRF